MMKNPSGRILFTKVLVFLNIVFDRICKEHVNYLFVDVKLSVLSNGPFSCLRLLEFCKFTKY